MLGIYKFPRIFTPCKICDEGGGLIFGRGLLLVLNVVSIYNSFKNTSIRNLSSVIDNDESYLKFYCFFI